ncbi:MAG: oxidoreductase/nitrogenase, component 1 [Paenibacillaceae bacterium]|jgi:hypothetical protein|nr:oxidoreductase/nitrogenase, component 1 [Paenibacillaceae bacterium]
MRKLWRRLPPPSPDTSGVANVFYGMNGLVVFDDVQGCATNYSIYDEWRDAGIPNNIHPAKITNLDVVMGTGRQLNRRIDELLELMPKAEFIILGGSPLSSFIGTDLDAVCRNLTGRLGIPAAAIPVSGHDYYDKGAQRALLALGAMMLKGERRELPKSVNLLGALTLNLDEAAVAGLKIWSAGNGLTVLGNWGGNEETERLSNGKNASCNLVISQSALGLARRMEEEYGIPYAVGFPCGVKAAEVLAAALTGAPGSGRSSSGSGPWGRMLVIGEQILSNSLRSMLYADLGASRVDVASLFAMDRAYMEQEDIRIQDEEELCAHLARTSYDIIIADPFFERFARECVHSPSFVALPHTAISSKLFLEEFPPLTGAQAVRYWQEALDAAVLQRRDGEHAPITEYIP